MDIVVCFPTTLGGYDSTWMLLIGLPSLPHIIPVQVKTIVQKFVEIYISQIVHYMSPVSIISTRGSLFNSYFWRALKHCLGTQ